MMFLRSSRNQFNMSSLPVASKVNLRSYMVLGSPDDLECEVRRCSTMGIQVRWPRQGAQAYDRWFTCTVKHPEFTFTGYLRHTPAQPPSGMEDYQSIPPIGDREIIMTSGNHQPHQRGPPPWYYKYQNKNTLPQVKSKLLNCKQRIRYE